MKLICDICVANRAAAVSLAKQRHKYIKSTLALCKEPKGEEFCFLLFNCNEKTGRKYKIKENIKMVITKFLNEGKCTLQFKLPEHDFYIQADVIQLKSFLHLFKRVLDNKISEKELTCSTVGVTAVKSKDMAQKKLVIQKRSDYPLRGFPRTLETLHINEIKRSSLDAGILQLTKLRTLDLSHNEIKFLPEQLSKLALKELFISDNKLGLAPPNKWLWLDGVLAKNILLLDLSGNELKFVPDQLVKLQNIVTLKLNTNELVSLPSGIGNLEKLKVLDISNNKIKVLPGSIKKLRLNCLDISSNNFGERIRDNQLVEKNFSVLSLKESSGRIVLNRRIFYAPWIIPSTVCRYLDHAKYCVCGKSCLEVFLLQHQMLFLNNISSSISSSSDDDAFVPVECYFCSLKCFNSALSSRHRQNII